MDYPKPPEPFLELKIHNLDSTPPISALCAGYECGEWRSSQLAEHAMEWLPEFCLTANELKSITSSNALKMIRKAAQLVYQTDKYKNRGEFGELFLHIVLRQIYGSIPAISKIYFKDAVNTTVKGFDAVHIININDTFELWLGEVKFYNNAGQAIRDVIDEIKIHTTQDYLKNEKMLLLNKIDIEQESPFYPILSKLLNDNTSLDELFDCACIPILITYDSKTLKKHAKTTEEFNIELEHEVMNVFNDFK
ncbi:TPA: DUF1837 domain-containing protein, partial [Haemophilus influenzae]